MNTFMAGVISEPITCNSDRQILTLCYLNLNTESHKNPQFAFLVLLCQVQRDGVLCSDVFNKSVIIMKQLSFGQNKQYWYVSSLQDVELYHP